MSLYKIYLLYDNGDEENVGICTTIEQAEEQANRIKDIQARCFNADRTVENVVIRETHFNAEI